MWSVCSQSCFEKGKETQIISVFFFLSSRIQEDSMTTKHKFIFLNLNYFVFYSFVLLLNILAPLIDLKQVLIYHCFF